MITIGKIENEDRRQRTDFYCSTAKRSTTHVQVSREWTLVFARGPKSPINARRSWGLLRGGCGCLLYSISKGEINQCLTPTVPTKTERNVQKGGFTGAPAFLSAFGSWRTHLLKFVLLAHQFISSLARQLISSLARSLVSRFRFPLSYGDTVAAISKQLHGSSIQ